MSDTSNDQQAAGGGQTYPIFYKQPEVLRAEVHGGLELRPGSSFEFAGATNALPINAAEFALVARDYPIVFVGGDVPTPVAIVGLRKDENLMIDADGAWAPGTFIPAYVRRYPFVFVQNEESSQFALCIDRASERIAEGTQQPFFEGNEPADITRQALQFCTTFQQQATATGQICQILAEQRLFKTNQGTFTLETGETLALTDFQIVDEAKLNAQTDDAFVALRKSGALAAIYCHLVSMNSWATLVRRAAG